jgi:hypothetical protein
MEDVGASQNRITEDIVMMGEETIGLITDVVIRGFEVKSIKAKEITTQTAHGRRERKKREIVELNASGKCQEGQQIGSSPMAGAGQCSNSGSGSQSSGGDRYPIVDDHRSERL